MNSNESNNPTLNGLIDTYSLLKTLGALSKDVEQYDSFLLVVENFNKLFKDRAWVLNDFLAMECYEKAVSLGLKNKLDEAEDSLIRGVNEGLSLFFHCLCSAKEFKQRSELLENAKELHLAKNYGASVPLLLIAIDGISNDISNLGLFAQESDINVWDSICQYDNAFTYLQKNFLTKSRTKTNLEEIYDPFRNGILHGRDLNYANVHVSSKCWNTLFVLRTWYRDKKDEDFKKAKLESQKDLSRENQVTISYLQQFDKRKDDFAFIKESGAYKVANTFLESWRGKQWGKISPYMYHLAGKHHGKAAKEVKETYDDFELLEFRCGDVTCDTPSSVLIDTHLTILYRDKKEDYQINLRVCYISDELLPLVINHPEGRWCIMQNCLSKILFGRN